MAAYKKQEIRKLSHNMEYLESFLDACENNAVKLRVGGWAITNRNPLLDIDELEEDTQTEILFALQNDLERKKRKYKELIEQELRELSDEV